MRAKIGYFILILLLPIAYVLSFAYSFSFDAEVPKEIEIGKWFNVTVNISSESYKNVSVYSYVFKGLNCVSQGWTVNKKEVKLSPGKNFVILEDRIKEGTEEGIYKLRVKVADENLKLNKTYYVKVINSENTYIENYIYSILIALSIVGLVLFWRFGK